MPKGKKTETQPIEWDDAMMLLDRLRDKDQDNTRLMLASGFYFGLRIGDILSLKWNHISGDQFTLQESKTKKDRQITIHPEFKVVRDQILDNMRTKPNPDSYIFIYERKGADQTKPISTTAANKRIKKVFGRYRIKVQNPSSHTLRKTFGKRVYTHLDCSEDALIKLSEIFNHSNVAVTRRYIGISQEVIKDIYLSI